jgi:hypothetical protein
MSNTHASTAPASALGRALEAWATGRYPCRADVRELISEGYDVAQMEARHFTPRTWPTPDQDQQTALSLED